MRRLEDEKEVEGCGGGGVVEKVSASSATTA